MSQGQKFGLPWSGLQCLFRFASLAAKAGMISKNRAFMALFEPENSRKFIDVWTFK